MSHTPTVLNFTDQTETRGHYPVIGPDGVLVAVIERAPGHRSFTAHAPNGTVLCSGTPRRLRRAYAVVDGAGRPIITFRSPPLALRRAGARLADGTRLRLKVTLRTGTWTVTGPGRVPVATIELAHGRRHPETVTAQVLDRSLDLALAIGLVQGQVQDKQRTTVWDIVLFFN